MRTRNGPARRQDDRGIGPARGRIIRSLTDNRTRARTMTDTIPDRNRCCTQEIHDRCWVLTTPSLRRPVDHKGRPTRVWGRRKTLYVTNVVFPSATVLLSRIITVVPLCTPRAVTVQTARTRVVQRDDNRLFPRLQSPRVPAYARNDRIVCRSVREIRKLTR